MKTKTAALLLALAGSSQAGFFDALKGWGEKIIGAFHKEDPSREAREREGEREGEDSERESPLVRMQPNDIQHLRDLWLAHSDSAVATIFNGSTPANSNMMLEVMTQATTGYQIAWTSLGPAPASNEANYKGDTRDVPVGHAKSILPDPGNPNKVLVGFGSGGIWRSTNASQVGTGSPAPYLATWTSVSDWAASSCINAMAWDIDSLGKVAFAGTGTWISATPTGRSNWQGIGGGMLRSNDSGKTWNSIAATLSPADSGAWKDVWDIASLKDASNAAVVLAATDSGVFYSTDHGVKWIRSTFNINYKVAKIHSLTVATATNGLVYAVGDSGVCGLGVFRSTDGGRTWSQTAGISNPVGSWRGPAKIMVAKSKQSVLYIAHFHGGSDGDVRLFVSQNSGASWTTIWDKTTDNVIWDSNQTYNKQFDWTLGGGHLSLWVNPVNPANVFVGNDILLAFKVQLTSTPSCSTVVQTNLSYWGNIHADQWAIASVSPNATTQASLWVGTDGGLFRLDRVDQYLNHSIVGTRVSKGISTSIARGDAADDGRVGVGAWDNPVVERTSAGTWGSPLACCDGDGFAYSPDGRNYAYSYSQRDGDHVVTKALGEIMHQQPESIPMQPMRNAAGEDGVLMSSDGFTPQWVPIWRTTSSADILASAVPFPLAAPPNVYPRALKTDPANPTEGVVGGDLGGLPRLWTVSTLSPGSSREILRVSPPGTPAASLTSPTGVCGGVSYSIDNNSSGTSPESPNGLAFDPNKRGRLYVATTLYEGNPGVMKKRASIWKTEDYRANPPVWTPVACTENGFPDVSVLDLAVDPANSNVVFAATSVGLYVSVDGGATWGRNLGNGSWSTDNIGPANVRILRIAIRGRKIYLFTYGRGVWVGTLPDGPTASITAQPSGPQSFNPRTYTVSASSSGASVAKVEFFVNGKLLKSATASPWTATIPSANQQLGTNEVKVVVTDSRGLMTTLNSSFGNPRSLVPTWINTVLDP